MYVVAVAHNLYVKNLRTKCKIVSSSAWKSERFPRFTAPFSTRGDPFRLLFPLPCPPASTSPGEGLPGGLLEGSCGRRKHKNMRNRPKVGTFMSASEYQTLIIRRRRKKLRLYVRYPPIHGMICSVFIYLFVCLFVIH